MKVKLIRPDGRVGGVEIVDGIKNLGNQAGSTLALNFDDASVLEMILTGNITTITISGGVEGIVYGIVITQDNVGTRILSGWPVDFEVSDGTLPVLSTAAAAKDCFRLVKHGDHYCAMGFFKNLLTIP